MQGKHPICCHVGSLELLLPLFWFSYLTAYQNMMFGVCFSFSLLSFCPTPPYYCYFPCGSDQGCHEFIIQLWTSTHIHRNAFIHLPVVLRITSDARSKLGVLGDVCIVTFASSQGKKVETEFLNQVHRGILFLLSCPLEHLRPTNGLCLRETQPKGVTASVWVPASEGLLELWIKKLCYPLLDLSGYVSSCLDSPTKRMRLYSHRGHILHLLESFLQIQRSSYSRICFPKENTGRSQVSRLISVAG